MAYWMKRKLIMTQAKWCVRVSALTHTHTAQPSQSSLFNKIVFMSDSAVCVCERVCVCLEQDSSL